MGSHRSVRALLQGVGPVLGTVETAHALGSVDRRHAHAERQAGRARGGDRNRTNKSVMAAHVLLTPARAVGGAASLLATTGIRDVEMRRSVKGPIALDVTPRC